MRDLKTDPYLSARKAHKPKVIVPNLCKIYFRTLDEHFYALFINFEVA